RHRGGHRECDGGHAAPRCGLCSPATRGGRNPSLARRGRSTVRRPAYRDRVPVVSLEWTPTWREAGTCPCPPTETRRDADSSGGTHYDFRPSADGAAGASVRGQAGWSTRCAATERELANATEKTRSGGGGGSPASRRDTLSPPAPARPS